MTTIRRILLLLFLAGTAPLNAHKVKSTHRLTVTFNYDFTVTPACSPKVKQGCVQQFNLYDISAGIPKRVKLGAIPVPNGATGFVKGISATSQPFQIKSGNHKFAVSAQRPDGIESDFSKCMIKVKVP
ncbi:MAG: hypothetical protein WBR26_10515 [Candidatus Acidiferrum sp.]